MFAYMIDNSTKAGKATKIEFFMQAPPSLQALIIPDLRVCVNLCEVHCMATQD